MICRRTHCVHTTPTQHPLRWAFCCPGGERRAIPRPRTHPPRVVDRHPPRSGPGRPSVDASAVDLLRLMAHRALKVCSCIGCAAHPGSCPELVSKGKCEDCGREAEQRRGTRQQRGYDAAHDRLRGQWKPKVESGDVDCARCGRPILAGQAWALDHNDDRTAYLGPSHATCNNRAGGRAAHP